jgi:predicted dehydrogenase
MPSPSRPIPSKTIGVIGLGSIGLRHALNLCELGHSVVGYDPHPTEKAIKQITIYDDINHVIEESDAVVIAGPTYLHADHIHECLLAKKPFFVEKPIKDKWMIDKEGIEATMVGYNLRFHSCVKKAKEWINQGFLGYPQWANFVCAQYSDKPRYLADGVILNWSHEIDLALYFLGPADVMASSTLLNPHDTMTDIILRHHESGCRSVIHLDYLTRPEIRQSIIVGTDATIIMDLVHRQAWLRLLSGAIADHFDGDDSWEENYQEEMRAFIDRIDGKRTLGCTGREAMETLKICMIAKQEAGV